MVITMRGKINVTILLIVVVGTIYVSYNYVVRDNSAVLDLGMTFEEFKEKYNARVNWEFEDYFFYSDIVRWVGSDKSPYLMEDERISNRIIYRYCDFKSTIMKIEVEIPTTKIKSIEIYTETPENVANDEIEKRFKKHTVIFKFVYYVLNPEDKIWEEMLFDKIDGKEIEIYLYENWKYYVYGDMDIVKTVITAKDRTK